MKGKFVISGVGMGLAFILTFADSLAMATGAFVFWAFKKRCTDPKTNTHKIFVQNYETVCAGGVAGGALIGIVLIILEAMK